MAAFVELFGEKLLGKEGEVQTAEALDGKAGVFIYFSAHWCPPCRGFTPKLAEFHTKFSAEKNFATVFASSDSNEESFNEYYGEMPWLALPFSERGTKAALSKKFKVRGIPTLVLLGPDGKLVTTEGRGKVMRHMEDCEGFPWIPKPLGEILGDSFLKKDGSTVGKEAIEGKTLGLYFSAHWCPPCRQFTPKLAEFYKNYTEGGGDLEIVFVSSDRSEEGMLEYFNNAHGDYLALPFDKRSEKNELSRACQVNGIPTFVVVGPDGKTITTNGRGKVASGVEAVLQNGWGPPPVGDLARGVEAGGTDINACSTVVVMCENAEADAQDAAYAAMTPLAKQYLDEARETGEDPKYIFFIVKGGGGPADQLKRLVQKDAGEDMSAMGDKPIMLLFDIPDRGGFYLSKAEEITTESIEAFLKSKEEGNETRLQLQK